MNDNITTDDTLSVVYQFTPSELRSRLASLPDGFDEVAERVAAKEATPEWLREQALKLLDTPASRRGVKEALAVRRSLRGDIEARRKELKAGALEYGRKVDSVAKELTGIVLETEAPLKALKAADDERREEEKRAKEEAERLAREEELRVAREAEEARLRAEREAEERRLSEERAKLEAERAAMAAEQSRLKAEREAQEAAQRVEQERRDAEARAERERLEAERQALEEQKRKAEREEAERQARIRAETEAKERAERERRESEEAAVREKERQAELARRLEALRPDREKLAEWSDELASIAGPDLVDDAARDVVVDALKWIGRAREEIADFLQCTGAAKDGDK